MPSKLRATWGMVVAEFYPRWRSAGQWRVRARAGRQGNGYCDVERKIVHVVPSPIPGETEVSLIHEIAHAVVGTHHGVRWRNQIAVAAARARALGREDVAELLDEEVELYNEPARGDEGRSMFRNAVAMNPEIPFEQARRWLASELGMPIAEIKRHYPRLRTMYEKARRDGLRLEKLRARVIQEVATARAVGPGRGVRD